MENNQLVAAVVAAAEKGEFTEEELLSAVEAGTEKAKRAVIESLVDGRRLSLVNGKITRRPEDTVATRRWAVEQTTRKESPTKDVLLASGVTEADQDALHAFGLLEFKEAKAGEEATAKLPLGAEEVPWDRGLYLEVCGSLMSPVEDAVLFALAEMEDWVTAEDVQTKVNHERDPNEEGSGWLAIQQVEEHLSALFKSGAVDTRADDENKRFWRESRASVQERRGRVLMTLVGWEGLSVRQVSATAGFPEAIVKGDLLALQGQGVVYLWTEKNTQKVDGEDVEVLEEMAALHVSRSGVLAPVMAATGFLLDQERGEAQAANSIADEIKETAAWRKKYEEQKKRADDLSAWLQRHGVDEVAALDQIRGVHRAPTVKGVPFEFTQARSINAAEKGAILEEILVLENQIAAIRLERESAVDSCKGRIKEIEEQIKNLKNATQSNQRIVTIAAHKQTFFDEGVERIFADDDGRLLDERPLPKGTQGGLFGEAKPEEKPAPDVVTKEDIAATAAKLKERGFKVSESKTLPPEEEDNIDDSDDEDEDSAAADAAAENDEPGPLATEEQRRARRSRKPKAEATAST